MCDIAFRRVVLSRRHLISRTDAEHCRRACELLHRAEWQTSANRLVLRMAIDHNAVERRNPVKQRVGDDRIDVNHNPKVAFDHDVGAKIRHGVEDRVVVIELDLKG